MIINAYFLADGQCCCSDEAEIEGKIELKVYLKIYLVESMIVVIVGVGVMRTLVTKGFEGSFSFTSSVLSPDAAKSSFPNGSDGDLMGKTSLEVSYINV